jgi:SAM-dependent methyltransferase
MTSPPPDPSSAFYDDLAELYHWVYADWERSIGVQGEALAGVLRERWSPCERVLDAACGIGTQAMGLAAAGFQVTGSDLSDGAVARARREAAARGLTIDFSVADLRALSAVHAPDPPGWDAVLACDNAIPHLLTDGEILRAFREMRALVRPGGGCIISARDYSEVEKGGTRMVPYGSRETPDGQLHLFQIWDFVDDERYDVAFWFVHEPPPGSDAEPRTRVFRSRYYTVGLDRLAELLEEAGFRDVERLDGRFFQPLLMATNG